MDFKGFYDKIIFDVDKPILRKYTGKQGDTKSRGLYVTVTQRNVVIKDLTGLSMRLFYEKPDKTRGFIDGVVDGDKFRIDYTNQMFTVPGVVKAELRLMGANGEVITDKAFKISVDSSIADGSIISKDERGILDRAFELAEDIIPRLELLDVELLEDVQDEMLGARHSNTKDETYENLGDRLDAAEQDLLDHKAEYTSNRQQDQLKIAKVEKELNDYKATIQQINIHQSPTQKATGHGIISLPPNAAEGQVSSAGIKGLTATNLVKNGDFSNGTAEWTTHLGNITVTNGVLHFRVLHSHARLFNRFSIIAGDKYYLKHKNLQIDKPENKKTLVITTGMDAAQFVENLTTANIDEKLGDYSLIFEPTENANGIRYNFGTYNTDTDETTYTLESMLCVNLTQTFGAGNEPAIEECDKMFSRYIDGTKSTVSAFRIQTKDDAGNIISQAYAVAKDDMGNIIELRSLPNGTKDEINVTDRKLIKRIGEKSNIANGMVIDFADMAEGGTYYAWNEDGETETGIKGDTLGIDATTLTYQLATPIEIPIQTSGSLVSYPSGTVYIEPFVADAGIYTDKMSVLHQDLPIKVLEKLSKIDFMTGLETELDVSDAVISEDRLSFTHPDLVDGDVVFYTYEYDRESTEGEAEIEYYDSRYVVKDSVTGKFYKWQITVANGVSSIELKEV